MLFQQPGDLAGVCVAAEFFFGEQQFAVHYELELAGITGDDLERGNVFFYAAVSHDFAHQTEGSRGVLSRYAIGQADINGHVVLLLSNKLSIV